MGCQVFQVACPGLAEAIEHADSQAMSTAIARAVAETPPQCRSVVLGCTQYPLVEDLIAQSLPRTCSVLHSASAVARQTLRRIGLHPLAHDGSSQIRLTVMESGHHSALPKVALSYRSGRELFARTARRI